MKKPRDPSASLEREVILAVIILYALICAVMLGVHYLEPGGARTRTSSSSPSHSEPAHGEPAQRQPVQGGDER